MIRCATCRMPLKPEIFNTADLSPCPSCGVFTRVDIFPSLFREPDPGAFGETLLIDKEASCFYHPQKKAVILCSSCGRFLCALCDLELYGSHLCPSCLEVGKQKKKIKNLENHRTLYDSITLYTAVLSMLFWFISFITAPVVIFMTIRYWKVPTSIIPRTRVRFIAAFIIAGLQIAVWSVVLYIFITR